MNALTYFFGSCVFVWFFPALSAGIWTVGKISWPFLNEAFADASQLLVTPLQPQSSPQVLFEWVMRGTVGHRALDQDPVCQEGIIYTHAAPQLCAPGSWASKHQHLFGSLQSSVFTGMQMDPAKDRTLDYMDFHICWTQSPAFPWTGQPKAYLGVLQISPAFSSSLISFPRCFSPAIRCSNKVSQSTELCC